MRAPLSKTERQRLVALADYGVIDTPKERDFDDIASLAAAICECQVALISLVADDRQWFKATSGIEIAETPREFAICAHALLQDDILEIEDTTADPRTADNRLVVGNHGVRFYAGAQLRTPKGHVLGTLCVMDNKPRRLTDLQRQTLRTLADQVMTQLELRRTVRNQEILHQEMDHRVKNSLQTVQSLIRLYSAKIEDQTATEAFAAIDRRLTAVISLHKELHQSTSVARVRMQPFLQGILAHLRETCPDAVVLEAFVDDFELTSTEAAALAVVLSECVANAIKHAFPGDRPGRIRVSCTCDEGNRVRMLCADDGVGADEAEPSKLTSLGLRIMEASAQQIDGALTRETSDKGYSIALTFETDVGP